MTEVLELKLASIEVGNDRARDLDPVWAEGLAAIIATQGLLSPIVVRRLGDSYRLVAGMHRFDAFRILGRDTIPAILSQAETDDQARLEEVMENLGRHDLIALDRCHHLYDLKQVWERMYPQAKHGGDRRSEMIKTQSLRLDPKPQEIMGFAAATAERIGLSRRSIEVAVKIWSGLTLVSRQRLLGTDVARKQTELKALSELDGVKQSKVLDAILDDDLSDVGNVAQALAYLDGSTAGSALERRYRALSDGFKALPDESFDQIVGENAERVIAALKRQGRL